MVRRYDGLTHGFFNTAWVIDKARDAIAEGAHTLREVFATNLPVRIATSTPSSRKSSQICQSNS